MIFDKNGIHKFNIVSRVDYKYLKKVLFILLMIVLRVNLK